MIPPQLTKTAFEPQSVLVPTKQQFIPTMELFSRRMDCCNAKLLHNFWFSITTTTYHLDRYCCSSPTT